MLTRGFKTRQLAVIGKSSNSLGLLFISDHNLSKELVKVNHPSSSPTRSVTYLIINRKNNMKYSILPEQQPRRKSAFVNSAL